MPITESDLGDLLTVNEVAEILGCHRRTVSRMIADREIDVVRVGHKRGQIRITRRALLDHLNRGVVRAAKRPQQSA